MQIGSILILSRGVAKAEPNSSWTDFGRENARESHLVALNPLATLLGSDLKSSRAVAQEIVSPGLALFEVDVGEDCGEDGGRWNPKEAWSHHGSQAFDPAHFEGCSAPFEPRGDVVFSGGKAFVPGLG